MASSVAARLAALSKDLGKLDATLVKVAGKIVVDELRTQADRDTGGDGRLSGFGRKGAYLDTDLRPITRGVRIVPAKRTYATWLIVEAGANPHTIGGKHGKITGKGAVAKRKARADAIASGARGAFSGATPLRTPWGPRYRLTKPTSSPAKHTWQRAAERGLDAAAAAVRDEFHKVVSG